MSIEEANKSRFERGLMKLTGLEGELLEALESSTEGLHILNTDLGSVKAKMQIAHNVKIISKTYGYD